MRARSLTLATTTLALAAAAPASAAWSPPSVLSGSGAAFGPSVAFDASGIGHVAWEDGDRVGTATLAPGASRPGPVRTLLALGRRDAFPETAFGPDGLAIVALSRAPYPNRRVRVAFELPDGGVSGPRTISARDVQAGLPVLRADAAGDAILAWGAGTRKRGGTRVQYAIRKAGEGFGPVRELDGPRNPDGFQPEVAISPAGRIVIAFEGRTEVEAATGSIAEGLGPAQRLGTYNPNYAPAAAAIGDDGRAVVVWHDQRYVGSRGPETIRAAQAGPGGTFAPAVELDRGDGLGDDPPTAAVTADGTQLLAWPGDHAIRTAEAPAGGPFGAAATLTATGDYAVDPSLGLAPDGSALLTWTRDRDAPDDEGVFSVVQASVRPPGGAYGAPVAISAPDEEALRPAGAVTADGHALLAWVQTPSGGADGNLQAAALTP